MSKNCARLAVLCAMIAAAPAQVNGVLGDLTLTTSQRGPLLLRSVVRYMFTSTAQFQGSLWTPVTPTDVCAPFSRHAAPVDADTSPADMSPAGASAMLTMSAAPVYGVGSTDDNGQWALLVVGGSATCPPQDAARFAAAAGASGMVWATDSVYSDAVFSASVAAGNSTTCSAITSVAITTALGALLVSELSFEGSLWVAVAADGTVNSNSNTAGPMSSFALLLIVVAALSVVATLMAITVAVGKCGLVSTAICDAVISSTGSMSFSDLNSSAADHDTETCPAVVGQKKCSQPTHFTFDNLTDVSVNLTYKSGSVSPVAGAAAFAPHSAAAAATTTTEQADTDNDDNDEEKVVDNEEDEEDEEGSWGAHVRAIQSADNSVFYSDHAFSADPIEANGEEYDDDEASQRHGGSTKSSMSPESNGPAGTSTSTGTSTTTSRSSNALF